MYVTITIQGSFIYTDNNATATEKFTLRRLNFPVKSGRSQLATGQQTAFLKDLLTLYHSPKS